MSDHAISNEVFQYWDQNSRGDSIVYPNQIIDMANTLCSWLLSSPKELFLSCFLLKKSEGQWTLDQMSFVEFVEKKPQISTRSILEKIWYKVQERCIPFGE